MIPQKLNIELAHDPTVPRLGICPKGLGKRIQTDTYMPVFMAALFTIVEMSTLIIKGGNNPSVHQQTNRQSTVYTCNRIFFSHTKEEALILAITWVNLKNILLNERSHSQRTPCCMIPLICMF